MNTNSVSVYCICFCLYWHTAAFQLGRAANASQPAATPPEAAPVSDLQSDASPRDCELSTLQTLGWQQAYKPSGYSIDTKLPSNCSLDTWQSLGCLQSLTNLTLTGSLPGLPDSWADNGSFSALQTMNFSLSGLTGSLPDSWAQPSAFPALQTMNFSVTCLTGTLPTIWAGSSAFPNLTALYLQQTNVTGHSLCLCFGKYRTFMLSASRPSTSHKPCALSTCLYCHRYAVVDEMHMAVATSWTAVVIQCCDLVTCVQGRSQLHGLVLKPLPSLRHSICTEHN